MRARFPALVCVVGLTLVACGGGGSPGPDAVTPLEALEGSWYGSAKWPAQDVTCRVEVDGSGAITEVALEGEVQPFKGQVTYTGERQFTVVLSTGVRGHLWTDLAGRHAALVLDDDSWGVLEKDVADPGARHTEDDVVGQTFSGPAVSLSPAFEIGATAPSNLAVEADGHFGGNVGTTTFVQHSTSWRLRLADSVHGLYLAMYVDSTGTEGVLLLLASPDGTFAVAFARASDQESGWRHRLYFQWTRQ